MLAHQERKQLDGITRLTGEVSAVCTMKYLQPETGIQKT